MNAAQSAALQELMRQHPDHAISEHYAICQSLNGKNTSRP